MINRRADGYGSAIPSGSAKQVFWITILPRTGHGFRLVPVFNQICRLSLSLSYRLVIVWAPMPELFGFSRLNKGKKYK